jgi:putative phosphotransacetylase
MENQRVERRSSGDSRIGQLLVEMGHLSEDQLKQALREQMRREKLGALSTVGEICYEIDDVIAEREGCFCPQCRANMFALAINGLPSRYVTDEYLILTFVERYRTEYAELVRNKLAEAVDTVKARPKGGCRGHRYKLDLEHIAAAGGFIDQVPVHVSNRHVHLSSEHVDALFGEGYTLTKWKDLIQPGQYAAREVVALAGEKGKIEKVRVLGPPRKKTQVEISGTDQYILGARVPVRDSGNLEGTPGLRLIGPAGEVVIDSGAIRALRHIHMTPEDARRIGVSQHDIVDVRLNGDRATVCEGVLVRISQDGALEMHIDTDEANAAGVPSESVGEILGPSIQVHLN